MEWSYLTLEVLATLVEDTVILCTVLSAAGRKYTGWKNAMLILALSVSASVIVSFMNEISSFSFVTPILSMAFVIFISSKLLSKGSFLVRSISCVLAYVLVQSLDYIILVFMGICYGVSENVFSVFMAPGFLRTFYVLIDKAADVVLYLVFRSCLAKLSLLRKKHQAVLLGLIGSTYVFVQFLFSIVISSDIGELQSAVIFSWFFALCFILAILALFSSLSKSEQMYQTQKMLQAENEMMAENYSQMNSLQKEYAKELHDFKHHLTAILGLSLENKQEQIPEYIQRLLSTSHPHTVVCHSGSDITDAIINCKYAEAKELHIAFSFVANLHDPVSIDPIDICGILSNQIDNAFDACKQIDNPKVRMVEVEVKQTQDMVFFLVKNTVAHDPFENNAVLQSTKQKGKKRHGLGLENIRGIAEKYNGSVRNEYVNGRFISSVSLCDKPLNT